MRQTFAYQFYCRPCKTNKQGMAPIEISLSVNGERTYIALPYKVSPELFNKKRRPQEVEDYLNSQRTVMARVLTDLSNNGLPLTARNVKDYFLTGGVKSYTVEELFNDYLKIKKLAVGKTLTKGVYKKYIYVRDLFFKTFDKEKECTAISNFVVQQFFGEIDRLYENSTACGYKTKFKSYIRFGLDNQKIKVNPLQGIKITKEKKPITFLTPEEIEKIKNVKLNDCLSKVRDCAVFQISSGLAYSDCVSLTPEDLQERDGVYYIKKARNKTGNTFVAPLLSDGLAVWRKYNGKLPFISNQKYNLFLKAVALNAGVEKRIYSHIFRHTYATTLLNSGVNIRTVAACIGDTLKVTDSFYAHLKDDTVLQEVSKVI